MSERTPRLNARHAMAPIPVVAATLFSFALPDIDLTTGFADSVVLITDTATWPLLPVLSVAALFMIISRRGISRRRRAIEAGVVVAVLLVALGGNAGLNEYVVKPLFGVPRPNIETLAGSGVLGTEFPDADAFYATGGKEARREVLRERLPAVEEPPLSDRVRARWIHETGYSFPSGHSTAAMTFASLFAALGLAWLGGWRRVVTLVVIPTWAVTVAYSRVLLEVHTAGDVTAGAIAGILWGWAAFSAVRWAVERAGA